MKHENAETPKRQNEGTGAESYRDQALQLVSCAGTDGEVRTVVLAPDGVVESKQGTFVVDAAGAAEIVAAFARHGVEIPVDFEHQTLGGEFAAGDGKAPAAGWITRLAYEKGRGLLADIRWNADARELIRGGQYGYLSPVLLVRKSDRRAVGVHSAALTNKPAIGGMERLAASETMKREDQTKNMDGKEKIGTDATETPTNQDALIAASVREALGLSKDADERTTLIAFGRVAVAALRNAEQEADIKAFLDKYVRAGVLDPNSKYETLQKDYQEIVALSMSNRGLAKGLLDKRIGMLPPNGRTTAPSDNVKSDRRTIIVNAVREFRDDPQHAKLTTAKAFANLALMEAGLATLHTNEMNLVSD
ncbi:MAG: phage protease [Phycisphaerales bacterium]|nr:phage protease [Phycisphaerales bacterium]